MRIEWDDHAIKKMTNEIIGEQASQLQTVLDRVLRLAKGKTVEQVKSLLEREWRSGFGGEISDPELSEYAKTLAEGTRIVVRAEVNS